MSRKREKEVEYRDEEIFELFPKFSYTVEEKTGQLYLCFRDGEGKYCPLWGDGKSCSDFEYLVRCEYEEQEAEAQRTYCERCRWNGRKQKCACCRRNRHMKDNYEEAEET